jgi:hypothetical protein
MKYEIIVPCGLHNEISLNCSVGIVTGYWLDDRGLSPARSKIFLSSTEVKTDLKPTQPPTQWVSGAVSPGVRRQECEADRLPLSSAQVKKGGVIPSLPKMFSRRNA